MNPFQSSFRRFGTVAAALFLAGQTVMLHGAVALDNGLVRADFNSRGLLSIRETGAPGEVRWARDEVAVFVGDDVVESEYLQPVLEASSATNRVYRMDSGRWTVRVNYELQPGWRFVSKQVSVSGSGERGFRVRRFDLLRNQLAQLPGDELRQREFDFLRYTNASGVGKHGVFATLQNPFGQWKRQGTQVALGYSPDVVWPAGTNAYVSDRLCLGPYHTAGPSQPAHMVPEWRLQADSLEVGPRLDVAEVDAAIACVREFLLARPQRSERVMVGWCVNDYQVDIATPTGRAEYQRIIDQAAAVGARNILFAPANSAESSLAENRDAWGWENLLWFGMGQKLRKGEWDPAKDKLPASVQQLVDYARTKDLRLLAYVYPSLPFLQQKEWTSWVPNGQPGGYLGADTGQRSFQDWFVGKLVDFQKHTGAGGFSFDHWWIAYDETVSSKYAQWDGCRRILAELRRQIPNVVVDGRQQYHGFGIWTWLAGTYPHPLVTDEQPESFPAFPDLHWSRVSADRQRRAAWHYRQECFAPVEIIPGYMTHQTPRLQLGGDCPRDRFRAADWDLLGWKYSVISAIATAPFNLVINFIPARDEREFAAFSATDQKWFRDWFDWTDKNLDVLRHLKPILGPPQVGFVDGTAAFDKGHGFVFLFNPNYRRLPVHFRLDDSIGLTAGEHFEIHLLYPTAEQGRALLPPGRADWKMGDMVNLEMAGNEAVVLEVVPAPATIGQPLLLGSAGKIAWRDGVLEISGVTGETGSGRALGVALPAGQSVSVVQVNGKAVPFKQTNSFASLNVRFAGARVPGRMPIGRYEPAFAGGVYSATNTLPKALWEQLAARKRQWPVDYTATERAATWLNSDRLLLFINVAEPNDETMTGVTLKVDGVAVPVVPAYSSIVRSNPKNTFVGWYADLTALTPDCEHIFTVELPKLAPGFFQGLFLDTVEAGYTAELSADN